MKVLIVFTVLLGITAAYAGNAHRFVIHGLAKPFDDYYNYLKCVPVQIDQYAMEYECEAVWNKYRQDFLDASIAFESCAHIETKKEE